MDDHPLSTTAFMFSTAAHKHRRHPHIRGQPFASRGQPLTVSAPEACEEVNLAERHFSTVGKAPPHIAEAHWPYRKGPQETPGQASALSENLPKNHRETATGALTLGTARTARPG